jgi:hypothetical protein
MQSSNRGVAGTRDNGGEIRMGHPPSPSQFLSVLPVFSVN